jgi:hypothetical protein
MKKDKLMKILLPAVIVLVAVVLAVLLLGQEGSGTAEKPSRTQPVWETAATVQTTAPADTTVPSQTVTEPVETQTEETREEPGQTDAPRTEPEEEPWEEPTEPETEPVYLEFPCQIPGTELVIGKVSAYDGLFLEDGQDIPVENVCAIVVTNISARDLEYAEITLNRDGAVLEFRVSGERIEAVHMLPGYTHNIINLSEEKDLVTVMWANEPFDPGKPDTFFEKVEA